MRIIWVGLLAFQMTLPAPLAAGSDPSGSPPDALARLQDRLHTFEQRRSYEGPPLTLNAALKEAPEKNPTLIALRKQVRGCALSPRPGALSHAADLRGSDLGLADQHAEPIQHRVLHAGGESRPSWPWQAPLTGGGRGEGRRARGT